MRGNITSLLKVIRVLEGDFAYFDILGNHGIRIAPSNRVFFHLFLRGTSVLVDDLTKQETEINVGDYVFVLNDRPHTIRSRTPGPIHTVSYFDADHDNDVPNSLIFGAGSTTTKTLSGCLSLDQALATSLLKILPDFLVIDGQSRGIMHATRYVYEARHLYNVTREAGANQFLVRLIELLMVEAIRIGTSYFTLKLDSALDMRGTSQVIEAMLVMSKDIHYKWSLSSLARRVGMSRSAFAAAFNCAVGKPPHRYLTELRMRHAADLLESEQYSVKDVAHRVGYDSEIAFGYAFKRHSGKTPTEYRRASQSAGSQYMADFGHWDDFVSLYRR